MQFELKVRVDVDPAIVSQKLGKERATRTILGQVLETIIEESLIDTLPGFVGNVKVLAL